MEEQAITISRVRLAENLVAGVQYLTKRNVLAELSATGSQFALSCKESRFANSSIEWIKITQVGVCQEYTSHQYYSAIQKALFSCHRPNKSQIIFLIHGDGTTINLYLGVKKLDESGSFMDHDTFAESMSAYLNTLLPGSKAKYIEDLDDIGSKLVDEIKDKKYRHLYALTGIPSFLPKDGEEMMTSIDTLIGPLSTKRFVYYVVADPMDEARVNQLMTQCMEMAGKIESVKAYNVSESYNTSTTIGKSDSISETLSESEAEATKGEKYKHPFWSRFLTYMGLGNFIQETTDTITKGISKGESHTDSTSDTQGFAATSSMTLVNKCAEFAANQLMLHSKRYEEGLGLGMWETGVYLLTEDDYSAQNAAMQMRSIVSGKDTSLEPVRIHNLSKLLNTKDISSNMIGALATFCSPHILLNTLDGKVIKSNFEDRQERLTSFLTTEELSCYINLPQRSVPGISVVDYSFNFSLTPQNNEGKKDILPVGKLIYSGSQSNIEIGLPLDTLTRHSLVCGVNGSGKTNTVLSILDGFMKSDRPFLVIEPAKTEYVDWALEYNKTVADPKKKIKIFIPGCEKYSKANYTPDKLRINPFEVIALPNSEMRVLSHIDRLKSSFASAFPMQDILPVIMEHLLYYLYSEDLTSSSGEMTGNSDLQFPTLDIVNREFIDNLMKDIGYAKENTQNISAALRTRFKSLKYGWKGDLLNNPKLTGMTWDMLFGTPVVINLSYAGDDQDRAFIMSILLQFLYEYRIAEADAGMISFNSNLCRHLVVVEEAHRVMSRCDNPEAPQYKSGLMFSNFLSEVRAYGQGMMVVDQVPTRLIEDAIKNTNVKIIHKLVASDDSQRIAECIGLTNEQQKVIAKLSIGQAVLAGFNSANVASSNCSDIYLAQINRMK